MNEYWIYHRVKKLIKKYDTNEKGDTLNGLIKNNISERYKKIYKRDPLTSLQLPESNEIIVNDENDTLFKNIYEKYIEDVEKYIKEDKNSDPQDPELPNFDRYETYLTDKIGIEIITKMNDKLYNDLLQSYKDRLNNVSSKAIETELRILSSQNGGGNAKITKQSKKSILGKERCIYKKAGDRKEYLRYKGDLITVKDYTKLMKAKAAKA